MISDRSILRLLGLALQRDADGVSRPVSISPAEMPAGRACVGRFPVPTLISGASTCVGALPSRTVRRGSFSSKEVSQ